MSAFPRNPGIRSPVRVLLFVLAASVAATAAAEPGDDAPGGLRVVVSRPRIIGNLGDPPSERLHSILTETFSRELASSDITVIEASAPPDDPVPVLHLRYYVRQPQIVMFAELTEQERAFGGGVYTATTDLTLVTAVRRASADLIDQLHAFHALGARSYRDRQVLLSLTISSADEHSSVSLGDNAPLGTVQEGLLRAPFTGLPVGSDITLVHRKEGYYPRYTDLTVDAEHMQVELEPLDPIITRETAAVWTSQRPVGLAAGLRQYLSPATLFLEGEAGLSTYYRFTSGSRASAQLDTRASIGGYPFGSRSSRLRFSVATGAGLTATVLGGGERAYWFFDPYFLPVSIALDVALARITPFLRIATVFYTAADSGILSNEVHPYTSVGVRIPWNS